MKKQRAATRSDPGLSAAIHAAGGLAQLARMLKLTLPAVAQWDRIPLKRVREIAFLTGVPEHQLRPDHFRNPTAMRKHA